MSKIKRAVSLTVLVLFLYLPAAMAGTAVFAGPGGCRCAGAAEQGCGELAPEELKSGRYFYLVDEKGRTLLITGRRLRTGDRFLNAQNELYKVVSAEGYLARARFVEKKELKAPASFSGGPAGVTPVQKEVKPAYKIAVYHTHNAESYVPSDGTESIYGAGGVHDVGRAFKGSLEAKGVNVLYSDQLHLPHDRGAYRRSRVTALRLLRERPDAIFDLHRDAAPWEKYALDLEGEEVTQIQIVVGMSNPGTAANEQFAYDLKGYADRLYPGLVHGVLLIWGSYNQDLSPLSLLLEVGAHTNTKEAAERGAARFGDVVSYYFYGPAILEGKKIAPGETPNAAPAQRSQYGIMRAFSGTILSLLLVSTGAAVGFYFLNSPDALGNIYLWWSELPGKAVALRRRSRVFWRNLPQLLRTVRRAAPFNLKDAWRKLRREGANLPRLFRKLGPGVRRLGRRSLDAARALWREAPQNLQRGWRQLRGESRALPGLLRGEISFLEKAAGNLFEGAAFNLHRFRIRLGLAWGEAKIEMAALSRLLREYTLLLRNRLRP